MPAVQVLSIAQPALGAVTLSGDVTLFPAPSAWVRSINYTFTKFSYRKYLRHLFKDFYSPRGQTTDVSIVPQRDASADD